MYIYRANNHIWYAVVVSIIYWREYSVSASSMLSNIDPPENIGLDYNTLPQVVMLLAIPPKHTPFPLF